MLRAWQAERNARGLAVELSSAQAGFEVREAGRPAPGWYADSITILDETGNRSETGFGNGPALHGMYVQSLCPYEPAWKIRARFVRTDEAHFTPAEVRSIGDLPVPSPGRVLRLNLPSRSERLQIRAGVVAGPGKVTYGAGGPVRAIRLRRYPGNLDVNSFSSWNGGTWTGGLVSHGRKPHVALKLQSLLPDERPTLVVEDEHGRPLRCGYWGQPDHSEAGWHLWKLETPPGARRLRARLAVQRCVAVDFIVRPPAPEPRPDPEKYLRRRDYRAAAAEYRRLLQAEPDNDVACNGLAWLYLVGPEALRRPEEALRLARHAVALDPLDGSERNTLALACCRTGRYREALEAEEVSLALKRSGTDTSGRQVTAQDLFVLAIARARLGRRSGARAALREAERQRRQVPQAPTYYSDELALLRSETLAALGGTLK
jgi:hypothetical protein